jgi:hypothetical protein
VAQVVVRPSRLRYEAAEKVSEEHLSAGRRTEFIPFYVDFFSSLAMQAGRLHHKQFKLGH